MRRTEGVVEVLLAHGAEVGDVQSVGAWGREEGLGGDVKVGGGVEGGDGDVGVVPHRQRQLSSEVSTGGIRAGTSSSPGQETYTLST